MQTMITDLQPADLDAHGARISVIVPVYNGAAYLRAALHSAFEQSLNPLEVIVVDDGSTDDSVDIARSCGAVVISVANGGPSAARNVGANAAAGEYLAFLDADDLWTPNKLELQYAAVKAQPTAAFSFTDYRVFDDGGMHPRVSELRRHAAFRKIARRSRSAGRDVILAADGRRPLLYDSYIAPSSVLVRRADYMAIGGFDESLRVTEDFEFFLRLLCIVPAVAVMEPLLLYRRHAGQATAKATDMKAGFLEVARRVAASPERYPRGDARYIARTAYLRQYRLGLQQARLGNFEDAARSFRQSLNERWTVAAISALGLTQVCRSTLGRTAFQTVRSLWKRRPGRR